MSKKLIGKNKQTKRRKKSFVPTLSQTVGFDYAASRNYMENTTRRTKNKSSKGSYVIDIPHMVKDITEENEFIDRLGDVATPYLDYLQSLNEGEWYLRDEFLLTKYGEVHIAAWELMKEKPSKKTGVSISVKGEEEKHPAQSLMQRKDEWSLFLSQKSQSLEDITSAFGVIQRLWKPRTLLDLLVCGKLKNLTDEEYWTLVMTIWRDTETPSHHYDLWEVIFAGREPDPSTVKDLPDQMTIYRAGHKSGLSWSLSYKTAKWFVRRSQGKGLWETIIKKEDILFYTNERDEREVVLRKPREWNEVEEITFVREEKFGEVVELEKVERLELYDIYEKTDFYGD